MAEIPVDLISPNPDQPRKNFDPVELQELANSIQLNGLTQAITVEEVPEGGYILIDGERRWRAHKLLGRTVISAYVLEPNGHDPKRRLLSALVANLERADLNPVEEALAFQRMRSDLGMTLAEVAERVGVSVATVYGKCQLLKLDQEILDLYAAGKLPWDARIVSAFLSVPDRFLRLQLARQAAARNSTAATIIRQCRRISGATEPARPIQAPAGEPVDMPAGVPISDRAAVKAPISQEGWNVLTAAKQTPPWPLVRDALVMTCQACDIYEIANQATCRGCQLVDLMITLNKAVKHAGK